jgi:hypothetical protein
MTAALRFKDSNVTRLRMVFDEPLLVAAPWRACIRSALLFDGCALAGLHSLRSSL